MAIVKGRGAPPIALALALAVAFAAATVSCSHLPFRDLVGPQRPGQARGLAQIDLAKAHQTILGFGASSGWTSPTMDDSQADAFFTVANGVGLSLLRMRITPDGTSLELATAKQAIARGASVWAAPWSPPAEWKDNHDVNNGGHLLPEHRQDWADRLVSFATNAAAEGVPLIALSAQNEPGYVPEPPNTWETCEYTPDSLTEFVRDYLGPTLAKHGLALPIVAPKTGGWDKFDGFASALLSDPAALAYVGPIATHSYSGSAHRLAASSAPGSRSGKPSTRICATPRTQAWDPLSRSPPRFTPTWSRET